MNNAIFLSVLTFSLIWIPLETGAQDPVDPPSTYMFPAYGHSYGIRKAGPTELFLFLGLRVKFSDPQGLACVRLNRLGRP